MDLVITHLSICFLLCIVFVIYGLVTNNGSIYTFYNKRTKKEFDEMMTISEMERYLSKNKHINQVIKGLNIVSSVGKDR